MSLGLALGVSLLPLLLLVTRPRDLNVALGAAVGAVLDSLSRP